MSPTKKKKIEETLLIVKITTRYELANYGAPTEIFINKVKTANVQRNLNSVAI